MSDTVILKEDVLYKTDKDFDVEKLNALTESVGWGIRKKTVWKKIIDKSSFIITAWCGEDIIGFGRVLEDGVMCMIYDIVVSPSYQKQGIGSEIMTYLTSEISKQNFASVGLFAWDKNPISIKFYEKFKFSCVEHGMKLAIKNMEN